MAHGAVATPRAFIAPIFFQSLLRARRVFRADGSRQSVALPLEAEPLDNRTRRRPEGFWSRRFAPQSLFPETFPGGLQCLLVPPSSRARPPECFRKCPSAPRSQTFFQ